LTAPAARERPPPAAVKTTARAGKGVALGVVPGEKVAVRVLDRVCRGVGAADGDAHAATATRLDDMVVK
jgi:hypothetical protein